MWLLFHQSLGSRACLLAFLLWCSIPKRSSLKMENLVWFVIQRCQSRVSWFHGSDVMRGIMEERARSNRAADFRVAGSRTRLRAKSQEQDTLQRHAPGVLFYLTSPHFPTSVPASFCHLGRRTLDWKTASIRLALVHCGQCHFWVSDPGLYKKGTRAS